MSQLKILEQKIEQFKQRHLKVKKSNNEEVSGTLFVVSELIGGVVVGAFIGYYLDRYFDTKMFYFVLLIILGVVSAFYNIYKKYKNL